MEPDASRRLLVSRIAKPGTFLALAAAGATLLVATVEDGSGVAATTTSPQAKGPVVLGFAGDVHFEGNAGAELASNPALVMSRWSPERLGAASVESRILTSAWT